MLGFILRAEKQKKKQKKRKEKVSFVLRFLWLHGNKILEGSYMDQPNI